MKTSIVSPFPIRRFRRLRQNESIRKLVRENNLNVHDLIWPLFICEGEKKKEPVISMPGVFRRSVDNIVEEVKKANELGITAICLFPYTKPSLKTSNCSEAWNPNNLSNRATRAIKKEIPNITVMTDVALDPYNSNGHDGIVKNGEIINDLTVEALVKQALSQAEAGTDIIGPSDMMDGRVGAIRNALEEKGYKNVMIMSYAAKFSSAFYGPFRDAVGASGSLKGDKSTYQMDIANANEAIRLVARDISEGADMVMIKPGLPYLDICTKIKNELGVPTFAYQVSGEYSMIQAASQIGWLDLEKIMIESLISFKRAGCDGILTYFALDVAHKLAKNSHV